MTTTETISEPAAILPADAGAIATPKGRPSSATGSAEPLAAELKQATNGSVVQRGKAVSAANVHYSSATPEWATPQEFFDRLNALHKFTLDPCSTHENRKCVKHYTAAENGLAQSWQGERVFMNPPYGREIVRWMQKAYEESRGSALVVCLVPARTDTRWWHDYAAKGQVTFIKGRLKFGAGKNSAPFPSAVIVLKPQNALPCGEQAATLNESSQATEKIP